MLFNTIFPNTTEYVLSLVNEFKIIKHSDNFIEFTYNSNLTNKAQITKNSDNTFDMILFHKQNAVFMCNNVSVDNIIDFLYNKTDCLWGND